MPFKEKKMSENYVIEEDEYRIAYSFVKFVNRK